MVGGCASLRPSSPVQKEEGLREEHGSFPRRKLRRGPHLIKPPQSPDNPAPCGIAPFSRRGADRARPPPASAGVRFSAIHLPEIDGILGVPAKAARLWGAVPQWRFRRNARDRKGELANPKGLTEGLWVAYRSGLTVAGCFLLHPTDNPSASHPLSTSPYTGEARGDGRSLALLPLHRGGKRWEVAPPVFRLPSWLPLTRELSPQATEGERLQPASAGYFASAAYFCGKCDCR